MSNPFDIAVFALRRELKKAVIDDPCPICSYEAAIAVLEAAAKVEPYYALCALDEPQMPEKGTESWKDWVKGHKQLREFIGALPPCPTPSAIDGEGGVKK